MARLLILLLAGTLLLGPVRSAEADPALDALRRGRSFIEEGRLADALGEFRQATAFNPTLPGAWALRGRLELELARFGDALGSLREACRVEPLAPEPAAALALLRIELSDVAGARSVLQPFLAADPPHPDVLVALGAAELAEARIEAARALFHRALEVRSNDVEALIGLARADERTERLDLVVSWCQRVLYFEPDHGTAHALLGFALFRRDDPEGATRHFLAACSGDPFHVRAHRHLGNGIFALLDAASELPGHELDDAAARRFVTIGSRAWRRGDSDAAVEAFQAALRANPVSLLAHNGLAVALQSRVDELARAEGLLRTRDPLRSAERLTPELSRFLHGEEALAPAEWSVIHEAILPFAVYLPTLVEMGATHEILPLDEGQTESPARAYNRGKRTNDLRLYDGLRAQGGLTAVTGIEKIAEAAAYRYNTFAHEFAHQVHHYALSERNRRDISRLYERAIDGGRALDYFAASNESEYFAVGYEAFISTWKRPGLSGTEGHTREELRRIDPGLYDFLQSLREPRDTEPPSTWEQGERLLARGRFVEAGRAYARTSRHSRNWRRAMVSAAEAFALGRELNQAESCLTEADRSGIRDNDLRATRAEIRLQRSRRKSEVLGALRDLAAERRRVRDLVQCLLHQGRFDEARDRCDRLLRSDESSAEGHLVWGRIARAEGKRIDAERAFRAAIENDKALAAGWAELGRVLAERIGVMTVESDHAIRLALIIAPDDARVRSIAGDTLLAAGDPAGALAHFDRALDREPRHGRALRGRAEALFALHPKTAGEGGREDLERDGEQTLDRAVSVLREGFLSDTWGRSTGLDCILGAPSALDLVEAFELRASRALARGDRAAALADLEAARDVIPEVERLHKAIDALGGQGR